MKQLSSFIAIGFAVVINMGIAAPSWSQSEVCEWQRGLDLGGCIFAIEGTYLYAADGIGLPPIGTTFENCYTFEADVTSGDKLDSGVWHDPFFPAPGAAMPGTWIQHNRGAMTEYTAMADDGQGVALVQTGEVTILPGAALMRLKAFSTVTVPGLGVIAEVLSRGQAVTECPFELP